MYSTWQSLIFFRRDEQEACAKKPLQISVPWKIKRLWRFCLGIKYSLDWVSAVIVLRNKTGFPPLCFKITTIILLKNQFLYQIRQSNVCCDFSNIIATSCDGISKDSKHFLQGHSGLTLEERLLRSEDRAWHSLNLGSPLTARSCSTPWGSVSEPVRWRDDFSFLSGFALGLVSDRKETGGLGTAGVDSGDYYTHTLAPTLKAGHCVAGSCSHLSPPLPTSSFRHHCSRFPGI